ncbi:hypothetical protein SK128_004389 [Halocaridina rubra]|uniref:Uncharacterized protein n=1 Tax=Halocaridina rubra TaxID=373956 RepID=A0AAN8WH10_HALRR
MERGIETSYCDYTSASHIEKNRQQSEAFLVQASRPIGHHNPTGVAVGVVGAPEPSPAVGIATGEVTHDPVTQLQACARSHHLHACPNALPSMILYVVCECLSAGQRSAKNG